MEFIVKNAADVDGQMDKIIKWADVNSLVTEDKNTYKEVYIDELTDMLQIEMEKGLSPYALCINGECPAYDRASKLSIEANSLNVDLSSLMQNIKSDCYKQRKKELQQLSEAVIKAIQEHEAKKKEFQQKANALKAVWNEIHSIVASYSSRNITVLTNYSLSANPSMDYTVKEQKDFSGKVISAQIDTPIPENSYDDDIAREENEIKLLTEKLKLILHEINIAKGEI